MKLQLTALAVLLAASMAGSSKAHNFTVGGRDGWVENPSEDFNKWASRNRFQINDNLVFRYKEEDSVLEVDNADYRTCNTSKPIESFHGGETVFRLTRGGAFFFIGGAGKCEKGQKMVVVVMAVHGAARGPAAAPAGLAAAGGPEAEAPPPVSAGSSYGVCSCMVATLVVLAVFVL
ncbi:early nodulin-like protein 1 [Wolffia australiana]